MGKISSAIQIFPPATHHHLENIDP
jgi:hypothetical protein